MIITKKINDVKELYLDLTGKKIVPCTILGDYRDNGASGFIDLGTFSFEEAAELTEIGLTAAGALTDGWNKKTPMQEMQGHACSSCFKRMEDGTVIMGRNMDLPISFSSMMLFRTRGNGKDRYDTANLFYTSPGSITFDQISEIGGIPQDILPLIFISACDTFNSEGLYLQLNMREGEDCPTSSTNPGAEFRTSCVTLCRILGDRCATIEEALEYLKSIDIYDPRCDLINWSMAIGMMDRTGRYGVLEFANNKLIWNEGRPGFACGHCNFYWNDEGAGSRWNSGYGRWSKLMAYYGGIRTSDDMERAMERIWYSNLFTDGSVAKDWKVDWFSELSDNCHFSIHEKWLKMIMDWKEQYGIDVDEEQLRIAQEFALKQDKEDYRWTNEYLNAPRNYYEVITVSDLFIKCFDQLPLDAKKLSGFMEASTISYVADNSDRGIKLRIFEMNDVFRVGIHETVIERHPTSKVHGSH